MAHGLAVSLLAGIRREVVWVGVAACFKCRGGIHGFIRIEKYLTYLPGAETICPCVSKNAREDGCRPSSS